LVVTRVAGEFAAFEVESVGTSLDVMLAPLDGLLAGVAGVAGATLLGDGKVLIVLDLHQLME
jgi:two-component system chemotaxis sensor kinase CheA